MLACARRLDTMLRNGLLFWLRQHNTAVAWRIGCQHMGQQHPSAAATAAVAQSRRPTHLCRGGQVNIVHTHASASNHLEAALGGLKHLPCDLQQGQPVWRRHLITQALTLITLQ